jgi:membrane fusion protein, copper/silver efflux system
VQSAGDHAAHQHGTSATIASVGPETSEFTVPVERQQQIGVTYATVEKKALNHTIRSVGLIVPDKSRRWQFVARVEGYVQKLHVTSPGEEIEQDQPLLTIYSPELLTAQREFVSLLQARDRATSPEARQSIEQTINSARLRLEQWNVTAKQIAELEKTRSASESLTLYSPFKGVVEDVPVDLGRKIMPGDHLVEVADLSLVWLWAEFYENELPMLKKGLKVAVTSSSFRGQKFDGEIGLINPFLDPTRRTAKVRINIPNPELKLRPGMYVDIELAMDMGEGLTIPVSAVMPTGSRALVFVDKGEGRLEPRFVEIGDKYGPLYSVEGGLHEGERIVASANFLIDAESKVQGAVKTFEEPAVESSGLNPVVRTTPLPDAARSLYAPRIETYLAIQMQLAQDKFATLVDPAAQLRKQAEAISTNDVAPSENADLYKQRVRAFAAEAETFSPANLDDARVQFGKLSAELIRLLTQFPPPLDRALTIMRCPMWERSPDRWLQAGAETENPFMGQSMLRCGKTVSALSSAK